MAVKNQLNSMMGKASGSGLTSIMNPNVQNGLNELIKTQRDQIIRMSQSQSIRDDASPDRNAAFDKSLSSNSKLISVPNQFANKLKEKAENFEYQRLMNNQSPKADQSFSPNKGGSLY